MLANHDFITADRCDSSLPKGVVTNFSSPQLCHCHVMLPLSQVPLAVHAVQWPMLHFSTLLGRHWPLQARVAILNAGIVVCHGVGVRCACTAQ